MWLLLLFPSFILTQVIKGEFDCDNHFTEDCQLPELFQWIPRQVDVFKALCPELSSYIQCKRDFDMKCEKEDNRIFEKPETYANLISLFNEMCDEATALNYVIIHNLKCFNETFSNTNCKQEMNDFLESYEKEELLVEFPAEKIIPHKVHCLSQIVLAGCIVEDIRSNCGAVHAGRAVLEIIHNSAFIESSCQSSYRESVLSSIHEFNLTEERKTFAIAELERMKVEDNVGEIDCDRYFFDQCEKPKLFEEIPRDVEVFKALCPELSSYPKCLRDYDLKCREGRDRILAEPENYAEFVSLFEDEICEEDEDLNEVSKEMLACFNETLSKNKCTNEINDFLQPYWEEVRVDKFTRMHVIPKRIQCLSEILLVNCYADEILIMCGMRAWTLTEEFVRWSGWVERSCPRKYRKGLLEDLHEFNLTPRQESWAKLDLLY